MMEVAGAFALRALALVNIVLGVFVMITHDVVGSAFLVLAGLDTFAGLLLARRQRHVFVPITCGLTAAGYIAFAAWTARFNGLHALLIAGALVPIWAWWQLPRRG